MNYAAWFGVILGIFKRDTPFLNDLSIIMTREANLSDYPLLQTGDIRQKW